jgi:hypothetical protein
LTSAHDQATFDNLLRDTARLFDANTLLDILLRRFGESRILQLPCAYSLSQMLEPMCAKDAGRHISLLCLRGIVAGARDDFINATCDVCIEQAIRHMHTLDTPPNDAVVDTGTCGDDLTALIVVQCLHTVRVALRLSHAQTDASTQNHRQQHDIHLQKYMYALLECATCTKASVRDAAVCALAAFDESATPDNASISRVLAMNAHHLMHTICIHLRHYSLHPRCPLVLCAALDMCNSKGERVQSHALVRAFV